jgi:hypothetical protein
MDIFHYLVAETVLREIGDFLNITPYPYAKRAAIQRDGAKGILYTSLLDDDNSIEMGVEWASFQRLKDANKQHGNVMTFTPEQESVLSKQQIYNVGFTINENEGQELITNQGTLMRILNTVQVMLKDFINEYNPNVLMVVSPGITQKRPTGNWQDNSKLRIFRHIIMEQLKNFAGWKLVEVGGGMLIVRTSLGL